VKIIDLPVSDMIKIAIASGKGGTGKTFFATNFFHVLLKNGYKTALVDCDAEAPNAVAFFKTIPGKCTEVTQMVPVIHTDACTYCAKCQDFCNYNAIFVLPPVKMIQVMEDLCHGCGACLVACKFNAITEKSVSLGRVTSYMIDGEQHLIEARTNIWIMSPVRVIKAAVKEIDIHSEVIILDAPPGTSCPFIQTVSVSDYVILITEPTPFGLSDLKQSIETLKILNKPFGVIINRTGIGNNHVEEYLYNEGIPLHLKIPFKKKIASLYSKGKLVVKNDPSFEKQILEVFETICEQNGNSHYQR
jgi:MinD superfamily P-loop ATPase